MGYKNVCIACRIAKNLGTDRDNFHEANCSNCGEKMIFLNHKFRPPKKRDDKGWKLVEYLVSNGFTFYHQSFENRYVEYPSTMEDAIEFVEKHKK